MKKTLTQPSERSDSEMLVRVDRRYFLRSAGVAAATGAFILGACTEQDLVSDDTVDLGEGDFGILNYAYALEQLEAAFYIQVMTTPYLNMTDMEKWILTDIRDHEIVHREFFKTALGSKAIKGLTPNFSSIDFADRKSVLGAAKLFEDTGVAAYNGAGKLIKDVNYLLVAGKIVSVEARHASAIADLINPNALEFAGGQINNMGLENAFSPSVILSGVQPFVMDKISGKNLPR
ncbi:ferritin-like domain-containing protein [Dyadobacter fanqingshengii]|uniref:Ferritin-like domain-containing protein n=1 Tax=Dyadobacter fanqingshengii TaxID=2906443 RepID=A0A9X1T9Q5_9BACT|nr:ferritin-like domain-containing protein [Dyadobacter fanqingshengii]MCF0040204.1 ferritin-like domain-containing protein [Dyadobacter fanqingshengii]MCF2502308.1 ferritin-like domain-containing protein [Dyadobacter fanqingshengii]USJ38047.1 ferritin-like domain-containing protein [Dyadobacter fanqingshengii]